MCQISGITYNNNALAHSFGYFDKKQQVGVLAQEIEQVLPEAVTLAPFDRYHDGTSISGKDYKTVHYHLLTPLLIEAIKELKARIEVLEKK